MLPDTVADPGLHKLASAGPLIDSISAGHINAPRPLIELLYVYRTFGALTNLTG